MPLEYMMSNSQTQERRRDLVLDDLRLDPGTNDLLSLLDRTDAPHVKPATAIKLKRRPPGVVSGLPNITPIFSRIWLMKMSAHFDLATPPVSLRRAIH